ncbi:MAG: Stk1 family PASTA domain-containing Ser/Thr kinase [Clostridium sp.]|uniref:Stk1 family PASTA domain-containing Ser/Thr kinase n=1 Tax=Clostridium sp. TaxID=1506 RepID=UPI003F362D4C
MNGEVLGNRYELLEKVGEGGMAIVYKARCNKLNRFVAVKILKKEYADNKEIVDKFKDEAMAVAKLSDMNIVNVLDVGTDENENYIVMEYVNGKTLKELVDQFGRLSYDTAITISLQIAKALECAHKNGIVHRDIKPQNILVTSEGVAKVTDFGIAKSVDSATLTNTSTILGSAHYFSPEQAKGGLVDYRSDIYSLGIVMYEMITGKVPFDADSPVTIALKHIQEAPMNPKELNRSMPEAYATIILKCIEKDVNKRYSNTKELIEDLKKIKNNPNATLGEEKTYSKVGSETIIMAPIKEDEIKEAEEKNKEYYDEDELDGYYDEEEDEEEEEEDERNEKSSRKEKKTTRNLLIGIAVAVIIIVVGAGSMFMFLNSKPKQKVENVKISNVIGMTESEAQTTLENQGLVAQFKEVEDPAKAGTVLSCNPSVGAEVQKGSTVQVTISKGEAGIEIPDLNGLSQQEAQSQLKSLGFTTILISQENNDNVPKGDVIAVTPQIGSKAQKTTPITLTISIGPKIVKQNVPNVVGMSQGQAEEALSNVNLKVNVVTKNTEDQSQDGKVLSVNPGAGSSVNEGTTVTITVAKYTPPTTVTIPNVVGNAGSSAASALENLGLTVNEQEASSETVAKGNVISVTPGVGATVNKGSSVTIVVSTGPKDVKPEGEGDGTKPPASGDGTTPTVTPNAVKPQQDTAKKEN